MTGRGGASHLEECQFFHKVGACRHGDKCVRKHVLPERSPAIVLVSMQLPSRGNNDSDAKLQEFVTDIFVELASMGRVHEMFVAANESQHLKGNVYISFATEQEAAHVLTNINSRWFAGRPVFAHYLPAKAVSTAVCRDGNQCKRQLDCNYAHPLHFDPAFWDRLFAGQYNEIVEKQKNGSAGDGHLGSTNSIEHSIVV